jgi:hypothetical protein
LEGGAVLKDTDPKIDALYEKMLLSRSGAERMQMAGSMYATAKALALASLREKYPHASEADFRGLLFLRFYAQDFSSEQRTKIYQHLVGKSD